MGENNCILFLTDVLIADAYSWQVIYIHIYIYIYIYIYMYICDHSRMCKASNYWKMTQRDSYTKGIEDYKDSNTE